MTPLGPHWRGARPGTEDVCRQFKQLGGKSLLNLERGYFEFLHNEVNQLAEWVVRSGLIWSHIELGDLLAPTSDEADAVLKILSSPDLYGYVYLCCLRGCDRTGWMSAAYRVKIQGWPLSQAIDEMYSLGFNQALYKPLGWVNALTAYCGA